MAYYNPYDAAKKITEEKQKWANARAKGLDTGAFEQSAAAYYKELRDNGRSDVADYLQKSDSVQASEYLKQLQPNYTADAGSLQQKSNDLYGLGTSAMKDISDSYDKVYKDTINVAPTRTWYGKDILDGYGIAADEAYKGTLGGNAEDNGGNVDSFAAANANRQKASVLSQGYGDVLNYYNSIAGNATTWAGDKATNVGKYLAQLQGNVDADRDVVKHAFDGTVDLWKTQDTNETEKELAELSADVTREQLAQEKVIADNKNATDIRVQQLKNSTKADSGTSKSDYDASAVVSNIISRHTKDRYSVTGNKDEFGDVYEKDGTTTDYNAVAADLQAILNDRELDFAYRNDLYNAAKSQGIKVTAPPAKGSYNQGTNEYNVIKAEISQNGNNAQSWANAYSKYGLDDTTAINLATDLGIDISDYLA